MNKKYESAIKEIDKLVVTKKDEKIRNTKNDGEKHICNSLKQLGCKEKNVMKW